MKFADTGWWVAWSLPGDAHHDDALALAASLGREQVLTTNHVVGETWTFLVRRAGHRVGVGFLGAVEQLRDDKRLVVHRVDDEQEQAAWQWLRRHDERHYSFVDATSFRVMHDRRLREALAFDQDFAAAGFVEATP
jgi:predicted nucleic acid-binding protein